MSSDPMEVDSTNGWNFNRYAYANNNPYKFTDPDGRNAISFIGGLIMETLNAAQGRGFDGDMVMGALLDGYDGQGDGFAAAAFQDATTLIPAGAIAGAAIKGLRAANHAGKVPKRAEALSSVKVDPKIVLSGGRGGGKLKNLVGPPNTAVRGGGERVFVTNDKGQVILDITRNRVKPVSPGQGFGPKRTPTQQELNILEKVLGGGA